MNKFLPFALPDLGEEEIAEVADSLRSGWLTTGPKTRQFEQEFAQFIGPGVEAIAVNSATSGLHLALEAIGVGPGDEVITTTHTFTATAEVIRYLGAHPVFVDVNPDTLNLNPQHFEAAITPRTKAVMPVHFAGLACEMESILAIARHHNLRVVEDAAHAIPTTYQGQLIGSLESDITVYSFYATKPIATGEGGMVVTSHPDLAKRCRVMRLHGISRDAFDRYTSTKPSWHYEVIAPGFKYNMTDMAASLGIHQLRKAWAFQRQRAAIAQRYDAELAHLPLKLPAHPLPGDTHSWHLYVIQIGPDAPVTRNQFIEQLAQAGVGCSVHYIPLHLHPYWRDTYHLRSKDFPCSSHAYEGLVSLPIYTKMTEADVTFVIEAIQKTLV